MKCFRLDRSGPLEIHRSSDNTLGALQPWLRFAMIGAVLAIGGWLAPSVQAQFTLTSTMTEAERDALYDDVARDVAELERKGNILKNVVRLSQPTVVHIEAKMVSSGMGRRPHEEAGSGVIVEYHETKYALTNRHVIKNATIDNVHVRTAANEDLSPLRIWADSGTDVAVLEIEGSDLIAARLGDSDKVDIGDFVLAVGSPFGLSHSVTYGIISAKGRRDLQLGVEGVRYQNFFQTDAAINPGNSGGPLLNLRGEVIGINTAIASSSGGSEGIGFTIPINVAISVARQLIDQGNVVRSFLGVQLDSQFDDVAARELGLPRRLGTHVNRVTVGTAAEEAGIEVGDVILSYGGVRIEDDDHLVNQVKLTPVNAPTKIVVYRNGETIELTARPQAQSD